MGFQDHHEAILAPTPYFVATTDINRAMASSPPGSPQGGPSRPASAMMRPPPRTGSRMSMTSKVGGGGLGGGSRASDEDSKTSVKVGKGHLHSSAEYRCANPQSSGAYSTTVKTHRSRVRIDPPTVPTVNGPCGVRQEPDNQLSARGEAIRFRQSIWREC